MKQLRIPLAILVAVIAAGAALIYYTHQSLQTTRRELAQTETQAKEARVRLQRSGEEKALIERYLGNYMALEQLGFVGDEKRINWVEGLRTANEDARLFGVEYQIAPQQPYPYAAELNPGALVLSQSVMKVTFRLLHEEDLGRFLATLARQNVGVFTVNQCKLARTETGGAIRFQPNLRAECDLAWVTAKAPPLAEAAKK
ncbi:MAG: hypothetical protein ACREUW_12090 [Burkholderiales bacterium]